MDIEIKRIEKNDPTPYDLLMMADPSLDMIEHYLANGTCYLARSGDFILGEYVTIPVSKDVVEVKNIAVYPKYRGQGIGKRMLAHAMEHAALRHYKKLLIGTGNSSLNQLALYQKIGFDIERIEKDFFIKNYTQPIYEGGIRCRHKVILTKQLV
ncbi:MAG: GNAT family N-acetyltransferase [Cyclobacteriaceae bacterium]|nr:GNAT family N-acetyltransferase [Cyclobacteriaceae bacterium HetDA_MAG_MS6]